MRGKKVMIDHDLAALYGVETKILNQAVRRNIERFPKDFVFELSLREAANLKSQFVTSSATHGGHRKIPVAFTEQGTAMLSSVLRSSAKCTLGYARLRPPTPGYAHLRPPTPVLTSISGMTRYRL